MVSSAPVIHSDLSQTPELPLFGWQAGRNGFVRIGLKPPLDYLYLCVLGGRGSGKTKAGALRMLAYQLAYPGCVGLVTAPTDKIFLRAILPTVEETYQKAGIAYEFNYTRREMIVDTGGKPCTIFFGSTDDPKTLPGPTCAFVWMDEARISPEAAYQHSLGTLRQAGYPHQVWITTTPLGKRHWITRLWLPSLYTPDSGEYWDANTKPKENFHIWNAWTKDNPFGGKELFQAMLDSLGENNPLVRQELYGEVMSLEGLVYPTWDSSYHVVSIDKWPIKKPTRVIAGVDFGFENPCAILVVGYDNEGRYYLMDEYYANHISHEQLAKAAKALQKKHSIQYFMCDSQGASWISAMQQANLPALRANKRVGSATDISSGIGQCSAALNKKLSDGSQAFFVNPELLHFRREIESYSVMETSEDYNPKEKPRNRMDHLMDAWRYAIMGINRFWGHGDNKPQALKLRWTN